MISANRHVARSQCGLLPIFWLLSLTCVKIAFAQQATAWCSVNAEDAAASLVHGQAVEVGSLNVQVVAANHQVESQHRLSSSSIIEIDRAEASRLTDGQLTAQLDKAHYYLVRAASVTVDETYHLWSQIDVRIYSDQKTALLFNGGLAHGHVQPKNMALLISTNYVVERVIRICSTAE